MTKFTKPEPVCDSKEIALLPKLTKEYERFIKPGPLAKISSLITAKISPNLRETMKIQVDKITEADIIKHLLNYSGMGFVKLQEFSSKYTLNKRTIITQLRIKYPELKLYEQICAIRSYDIEKHVQNGHYLKLIQALGEGILTGALGLPGIAANIVASFFVYFRAVQSIALFYGYDVISDPRELEIASQVTMVCLSPNIDESTTGVASILGKMMLAANFDALKEALKKMTYSEMAQKGGIDLLFVQIRALAHNAAKKALENTGNKDLEAGIFKTLLEQIGKNMTKEGGLKAVPILGGIITGLNDTYFMSRICKCANFVYHKRFIFEKEERVSVLFESNQN